MQIELLVLEYIRVFIWPITIFVIILIFKRQIQNLFTRIRKADFPGGISIETFPDKIDEAKEISEIVIKEEKEKQIKESKKVPSIPLNEVNTKMLNLGLTPSPSGLDLNYYRILSEQDPILALAGLRIELESMLKNLATGFKVPIAKNDGAGIIAKKLKEKYAITSNQYILIQSILKLSNAAVHGVKVTTKQANEILDLAEILRDQYISWLSWGFEK